MPKPGAEWAVEEPSAGEAVDPCPHNGQWNKAYKVAEHFNTAPVEGDKFFKGFRAKDVPAPLPAVAPPKVPKDASCRDLLLPPSWDQRPALERCMKQLWDAETVLSTVRSSLADVAAGCDAGYTSQGGSPVGRTSSIGQPSRMFVPPSVRPPSTSAPAGAESQASSATSQTAKDKWAAKDPGRKQPLVVDQVIVGSMEPTLAAQATQAIAESLAVIPEAEEQNETGFENPSVDVVWVPLVGGLSMPMVAPDAKIRVAWLCLGFMFIIYEAYAIPVYLAFDIKPEGPLFVIISVINTYFLLDITGQFFQCYMNKWGSIITQPSKVAKNYIRSWFFFDVVSALPWEWIDSSDGALNKLTRGVRLFRAARMLRLVRIVRIMKLKSIMEHMDTRIEANYVFMFLTGVLKITGLLFAVCHWGACVWYAIGRGGLTDGTVHGDGSPASWVRYHQENYPYIGQDRFHHYIYAMYFVLTTMTTVGYGDITPTCLGEVAFAMVLLVVSSVVFAGLMGTLTDMISALNSQTHDLQQKKMNLSQYMKWRVVPRRLMLSVRQHLLFLWDANKGYDAYEEALKLQLPPVLKAELCNHIYGKVLTTAPFLGWMKDYKIVVKFLAETVRSLCLERNDDIFRMGQLNDQIYILLSGEVVASRNEYLFANDGADEDHKGTLANSFDIPRNKDGGSRTMEFSEALAFAAHEAAKVGAQYSNGHKAPNGHKAQSDKRLTPRSGSFGAARTGNKFMDSEVMFAAYTELKRQDLRMQNAAKRVQRKWREKLRRRTLSAIDRDIAQKPCRRLEISRMTSKLIKAPAYFGESCLWQPVDDWDMPPPYLYAVRCLRRSEVVYISRASILEALDRFSPWLPERLDMFRETVVKKTQSILASDDILRDWHRDFAMADVGVPDNDLGMQDMHFRAITREDQSKQALRDGPAKPRTFSGGHQDETANYRMAATNFRRSASGLSRQPFSPGVI